MSFNSFAAIVHVVTDVETRTVGKHTITSCRAVHRYSYKDNSDAFMGLTFWGNKGVAALKIIKKGDNIFVKGTLTFREVGDRTYLDLNIDDFHRTDFVNNGKSMDPKSGRSVESVNVDVEEEIPF